MAGTGAERQRRYRAHKAGDHSMCDPGRCDGTAPAAVTGVTPVTRDVTPGPPAGLATRGRRLWRDLHALSKPRPVETVLIEEACRIADRLDRLDAVLRGDTDRWLDFRADEDGGQVVVVIDRALSEARQQATALKQICAELRQAAGKAATSVDQSQEDSFLDQLAARRAQRLANAAGS